MVLQSLAEALVNVLLYEWLHLFVFNHLRHTQCLYALDRVAAFAFPLEWYLCRALASLAGKEYAGRQVLPLALEYFLTYSVWLRLPLGGLHFEMRRSQDSALVC